MKAKKLIQKMLLNVDIPVCINVLPLLLQLFHTYTYNFIPLKMTLDSKKRIKKYSIKSFTLEYYYGCIHCWCSIMPEFLFLLWIFLFFVFILSECFTWWWWWFSFTLRLFGCFYSHNNNGRCYSSLYI